MGEGKGVGEEGVGGVGVRFGVWVRVRVWVRA